MGKKAFLEITNVCNLSCSFCHKTKRPARYMTVEEFSVAAGKVRSFADFLYFHVVGEPLMHPNLQKLFDIASDLGFKVIITTNGTLLKEREEVLLGAKALYKVSISLHSFEATEQKRDFQKYLDECFDFCERASKRGIIVVMRLWNLGAEDTLNDKVLKMMHSRFSDEQWTETRSGMRIADRIYLEWGERFEWPDEDADEKGANISCWGLRDQIGILSDGTVVPCCLDSDGAIPLGNIFKDELSDILSCERALALKSSFERRCVKEKLCLGCGYAHLKGY